MNDYQEDRFGTLLKVNAFIDQHRPTISINPAIETLDTELDNTRAQITVYNILASRDLKGFGDAKEEIRQGLVGLCIKVADGLVSRFATEPDPIVRKSKVDYFNYPKSSYDLIRDSNLHDRAIEIWNEADPIKTTMAVNLVTATDVDNLRTKATDYQVAISVPRKEEGISKSAREEMERYFTLAFNVQLPLLDNLMLPWRTNNAMLYSQYQTARAIDDSGGNSGTDGYEVQTLTVPANGTVTFPLDSPSTPEIEMYVRAINGSVYLCSSASPLAACTPGAGTYLAERAVTFKGTVSDLGIDLSLPHLNITNPSADAVIVRLGVKI